MRERRHNPYHASRVRHQASGGIHGGGSSPRETLAMTMPASYTWIMGLAQPVKTYTVAEYYAMERDAEFKSDYYAGEIYSMAGGTKSHSQIVLNLCGELRQALKGKPCAPFESNLRLTIKRTGLRTYPDASVYCGPMERDQEDTSGETYTNPTVLFEVLSPSTERYDRGLKSQSYRKIESLQTYVLVSQDSPLAEIYERTPDGSWRLEEAH